VLKHADEGSQPRLSGPAAAALFLIIWMTVCGTCGWAGEDAFERSKLSVADKVLNIVTEDLNADGLEDIMIIHRKGLPPDETRWISIFWHYEDGSFSTAADQSWPIDTTAVIIDIGDIAGDAKKEIVYLTPEEARYYSIGDGFYKDASTPLFETEGLAVFPSESSIPQIDFVRDWNDDGEDDVAVFAFEGLTIVRRGADGAFQTDSTIAMDLETGMGGFVFDTEQDVTAGLSASYNFPDIRLLDFNADGNRDIITTEDDEVTVYFQSDGRFSPEHDYRILFDVRTQKEKIEGIASMLTTISDLNNDGYADAIVTKQTAKGLSNFRGVINIYYGTPDGYGAEQDQVIISEGTASSISYIRDVNGDGRLDLILPSVKISISAIIRFLITRSVPIRFNIYLLNEEGMFSDRPDFTKEVKFKIDLSGDSDTQAMDLDGDYNGDKRKDFVFATGEDELSIYLGITDGGDRLFSKKPVAKVEANAFGQLSSPDLNQDGYSDMIIYYPQNKERKGMVEVLINRRRIE
jgi:hypothetical protein